MNLKNLLFEEESPKASAPATVVPSVQAAPLRQPVFVPVPVLDAMRKRATAASGPMVAFISSMETLAPFIPDEATRVKAVLKTLSGQGIAPGMLRGGITKAIGFIADEAKQFSDATAQRKKQDVDMAIARTRQLASEIDTLQAKIAKLQTEQSTLETDANAAMRDIETRSAKYHSASESLIEEFQNIEKRIGESS